MSHPQVRAKQTSNDVAEVIFQWSLKNPTNWKFAEAERQQWLRQKCAGEKLPSIGHKKTLEEWKVSRLSTEEFYDFKLKHMKQVQKQALGGPITAQRNSQRASAKRGLDADPVIAKHVSFPPSTTCEGSEEPLHTSIPPHDVLQATPALGPPRSTPPLLGIERSFEVKPMVKHMEAEGELPQNDEVLPQVAQEQTDGNLENRNRPSEVCMSTAEEQADAVSEVNPTAAVQTGPSLLESASTPRLPLLHLLDLDAGCERHFLQVQDIDAERKPPSPPILEVVHINTCIDTKVSPDVPGSPSTASVAANASTSLDSDHKEVLMTTVVSTAATASPAPPSQAEPSEDAAPCLRFTAQQPAHIPPLLPPDVAEATLGEDEAGRPTEDLVRFDSGPEVRPAAPPAAGIDSAGGDIADLLLGQVIHTLGAEALRTYLRHELGASEADTEQPAAPRDPGRGLEPPAALQFRDAALDVAGQCVQRGLPPLQDIDPVDLQRTVRHCVVEAIQEVTASSSSSTAALDPEAAAHVPKVATSVRAPEVHLGPANETHLLRLVMGLMAQDLETQLRRTYTRQRQRQSRRNATSARQPGDAADDEEESSSEGEVPLPWPDPVPHEAVAWDDTHTRIEAVPRPPTTKSASGRAGAGGRAPKRPSQRRVAFQLPPAERLSPWPPPPRPGLAEPVPNSPSITSTTSHASVQTFANLTEEATVQAAVDLSSCSTQSLPLLDTSHTQTSPLRSDAASQVAVPAAHPPLAPDRPPPTHAHHTQTQTEAPPPAVSPGPSLASLGAPAALPPSHPIPTLAIPGPAQAGAAVVTPLTLGLLNGQLVLLPVAAGAGSAAMVGSLAAEPKRERKPRKEREEERERRRASRRREREERERERDMEEAERRRDAGVRHSTTAAQDGAVAEVLLKAERLALESQRLALETDRQRLALGAEWMAQQLQPMPMPAAATPAAAPAAPSVEPSVLGELEERWAQHQEAAERRFEGHQAALHSRWLEHSEGLQSEQNRWLATMQAGVQQSLDLARSQQHGLARLAEVEYRLLKAMQLELELRQELVKEEARQYDWLRSTMAQERAWVQPLIASTRCLKRGPPSISSDSLTEVSVSTTNPSSVASSVGRLVFATTRARFDESLSEGEVEARSEGEVVEEPLRDVVYSRAGRRLRAAMAPGPLDPELSEGELGGPASLRSSMMSFGSTQTEGELRESWGRGRVAGAPSGTSADLDSAEESDGDPAWEPGWGRRGGP